MARPTGTGSRADASSQQDVSTEGFDPARWPELTKRILAIGPVDWGMTDQFDADGHAAHVRESVEITAKHFGQEGPQAMHGLYVAGTETVVCHTGTSPNSPTHAQILAGAWNWLHAIAMEARSGETERLDPKDDSAAIAQKGAA